VAVLEREVASLAAEAARRQHEAEAMAEAARLATAGLAVEELADRIAGGMRRLFGAASATVRRLRPDGALVAMAWAGSGLPGFERGHLLPPGVGLVGRAVALGQPVWTPDLLTEGGLRLTDEIRGVVRAAGSRAMLAVPLRGREGIIGTIALAYPAGRAFREDEVRLVEAFAGQAAVALDHARLLAETRERLRETETLLAVAGALSQPLPLVEAMRRVCREVGRAFGADMVGAYFLDGSRRALVPMAGYHVPKHLVQRFLDTPLPVDLFQEVWLERKPVWTPDYLADRRFDFPFLAQVRPGAVLISPTLVRGEIVGGLFLVWWKAGRTCAPAELDLVEGVASQVGLALENADLARQTRQKLEEMERLLAVGRTMASTLELGPLLREFLRHVARTVDADSVAMWLADPATGVLDPIAGYHVPADVVARVRGFRLDPRQSPLYADAIARRVAVVSANAPAEPRLPAALTALAPHQGQLFAPIVAKDRVIGAIIAAWWEREPALTERELALVEAMGAQAGVALENARLFEEHRRRLEELSVLHELSRAVTGQLDVGALAEAVHREASRVLDTGNLSVLLHDEARGVLTPALAVREGMRESGPPVDLPPDAGLAGLVVARRTPLRTAGYLEACRREGVRPLPAEEACPHWLGVPMVVGDEVLGALVLRSAARPFGEGDERLLANIASLAALAVRSARLYEERTRAYRELRSAQDRMVRTEKLRALGEMAAGVAHDFNNVLAVILGRAELLLREAREPGLVRGLETVRQAALDGAHTVRRIQEFTRTRRTRPFERIDLHQIVREVVEMNRPRWKDAAQSRGETYEITVEGGPVPPVAGSPEELREVFTNLLANALEAMPGGGRLGFALTVEGDQVAVAVRDTGSGMSEDTARRVFEPFFTTKGPQGSGLGLSVVWGIVMRHGGAIEVESRPGAGSTFTVRIPVARVLPPESPPPGPPGPARRARVVVVDDEPAVREILRDLLRTEGYEVLEAGEGRVGLALCETGPVDLVLTDVSMPGMSGWEVAEACLARFPGLPVGLLTGWGDQLDPAAIERHRIRFVVAKPFEAADVLRQVYHALDGVPIR
jgi:signal transduction histidine kinase